MKAVTESEKSDTKKGSSNLKTKDPQQIERAKKFVKTFKPAECDPTKMIEEISDLIDETKSPAKRPDTYERLGKKVSDSLCIYGLENHYPAAETISKELRPMVIEMANQITLEYECKNTSEKALAEMVAIAYVRYIQFSKAFNGLIFADFLGPEDVKSYSLISKEADKAQKQFISALSMLKQMKAPPIQFNIKTNTAFMANNQQVNALKVENRKKKL